jgi:ketosteroid isomerase-like protein
MSQSLTQAHEELYRALNVMLTGDAQPVVAVWSDAEDVTYAGPFGGFNTGNEAVKDSFRETAVLKLGGRIEISDVVIVETADMGYSVCTEHGIDHVINGESVNLTHRATNIFRREVSGWRLVHHHTDPSSE